MKPVRALFIMAVLFFAFGLVTTRADTIVLQNGRTLQGQIIGQGDNYIDIKTGSGKLKLNRKDVKSFEIKEPAEGYSEAEGTGAENKPASGNNAEKEASGKAEQPKPLLKLSVSAEYLSGRIRVAGKPAPPQDAQIRVYFIRNNEIIAVKQVVSRGENFFVTFGPFEKQVLPAGNYIIEAKGELKGQVIAAGSCPLVIGTAVQISKNEGDEKQRLSAALAKVQTLYDELNSTYSQNKENFDRKKWSEFSEKWLGNAHDQAKVLQAYSQTNVALMYPKAEKALEGCMAELLLLHDTYSSELTGNKDAGKGPMPPWMNPRSLNDGVVSALTEARKELPASDKK